MFYTLGVAKHTFNVWIITEKLSEKDYEELERKQSELKIPSDLGRITCSVGKHHNTMKADEWKHWVLIYSVYCLRGILPDRDLNIKHFSLKKFHQWF